MTFGEAPSLKQIGVGAFRSLTLKEIHIPDCTEELCDECFSDCQWLVQVTFGESSALKRIGVKAFDSCRALKGIRIPDRVEEICDNCFVKCVSLVSVTFGESSSLKHISDTAFVACPLKELRVPRHIREICAKWISLVGEAGS